MVKSLMLEISGKEGLYAISAKELLKSPSYTDIKVIQIKKTKISNIILTIHGTPSPGTLGDYWLLKDEYKRMDPTWISEHPDQWKRLNFNDQFMNYMLDQFGELHCEYCSKPNLKIFKWYEEQDKKTICTTDHFYPKGSYPHLAEDSSNLIISCFKCNNNKGEKIYDENRIAYIYDDKIRSNFVFDESKLSNKSFKRPK